VDKTGASGPFDGKHSAGVTEPFNDDETALSAKLVETAAPPDGSRAGRTGRCTVTKSLDGRPKARPTEGSSPQSQATHVTRRVRASHRAPRGPAARVPGERDRPS
jgi:hypothetical protein